VSGSGNYMLFWCMVGCGGVVFFFFFAFVFFFWGGGKGLHENIKSCNLNPRVCILHRECNCCQMRKKLLAFCFPKLCLLWDSFGSFCGLL